MTDPAEDAARTQDGVAADFATVAQQRAEFAQSGVERLAPSISTVMLPGKTLKLEIFTPAPKWAL
jgi:hypothetical protein